MADRDPVNEDTWLEFLGPPGAQACCGLCGNSGIVDTRGKVKTPRGDDCGVRAYCICPDGRALKHTLGVVVPEPPPIDHLQDAAKQSELPALLDMNDKSRERALTLLAAVLRIVRTIGGYMTFVDQQTLREARKLLEDDLPPEGGSG